MDDPVMLSEPSVGSNLSETRLVRDIVTSPAQSNAINPSTADSAWGVEFGSVPAIIDTILRVRTPENVAFEYQLAGPFKRIFAYWVDLVVSIVAFTTLALFFLLVMNLLVLPLAASVGLAELAQGFMMLMGGMMLILYFIVYWFYGAILETYCNGRTLGKRMARLRVLTVDGHSIDGVQAILRNFFRLLDIAPLLPLGILFTIDDPEAEQVLTNIGVPSCVVALVVMAMSRRFQRIGDVVAGTVVVSETESFQPTLLNFSDPRVPQLAELIPPTFVPSQQLMRAVASYADQRRRLPSQRAREIAAHVAVPLLEQFNIPSDTDYDLFLCALYFRTFTSLTENRVNA